MNQVIMTIVAVPFLAVLGIAYLASYFDDGVKDKIKDRAFEIFDNIAFG